MRLDTIVRGVAIPYFLIKLAATPIYAQETKVADVGNAGKSTTEEVESKVRYEKWVRQSSSDSYSLEVFPTESGGYELFEQSKGVKVSVSKGGYDPNNNKYEYIYGGTAVRVTNHNGIDTEFLDEESKDKDAVITFKVENYSRNSPKKRDFVSKGREWISRGFYENGIKILEKEIKKGNENPDIPVLLSGAYSSLADDQFKRGKQNYKKGNFKEAKKNLEKAVKFNNKESEYCSYLGHTYLNLGENNNAVKTLNNCLDTNPSSNVKNWISIGLDSCKAREYSSR